MGDERTVSRGRAVATAVVIVLIIVATRIPGIGSPPTDFANARQFHSLEIANERYVSSFGHRADPVDLAVARFNRSTTLKLEPPVLEAMYAYTWRATGGERVWVARLWAVLFFALSAIVLSRLARRMLGETAAVIAAGVYVVMPLSYDVSRAVMPQAAMLLALVVALRFLVPSEPERWWRPVAAGLATAIAGLLAPYSVLVPVGAWAGMMVWRCRRASKASLADTLRANASFPILAGGPVLAYYLLGHRNGAEDSRYFIPELYTHPSYWHGWAATIHRAGGLMALAAIAGVVLIRTGAARAFLIGAAAGYFVFGVLFTWHISTHPYYETPLLPLLALGAGAAGSWVVRRLGGGRGRAAITAWTAVAAAVVLLVASGWIARPHVDNGVDAQGRAIARSIKPVGVVAVLGNDYGRPLGYYGNFPVVGWLGSADFALDALMGAPPVSVRERLGPILHARWFVVTDFGEFHRQPDLERVLATYPIVASTPEFRIWKLGPR